MSMIAWLLISFAVLMFLGVPIGISLGLSAVGGMLFVNNSTDLMTITKRMFEGMNSWALLAIPLYTFAGYTMSKGGISSRLMDFCYAIVGHIYGGLAHVNVLASMIFAGISGSAVADTAGVSGMFMPTMLKKGYSKQLTVTVTGRVCPPRSASSSRRPSRWWSSPVSAPSPPARCSSAALSPVFSSVSPRC